MKATPAEKQRMREYYQTHRERIKDWNRTYKKERSRLPEVQAKRKAYWKKYYAVNKEKQQQRVRDIQTRLRRETFQAYGNQCSCCGEQELKFLALDHVLNDGAKDKRTPGRRGHALLRKIKMLGYPADYRILCHNCNLGRYLNGGTCPHEEKKLCASSSAD